VRDGGIDPPLQRAKEAVRAPAAKPRAAIQKRDYRLQRRYWLDKRAEGRLVTAVRFDIIYVFLQFLQASGR
jgi:hypothetical protein